MSCLGAGRSASTPPLSDSADFGIVLPTKRSSLGSGPRATRWLKDPQVQKAVGADQYVASMHEALDALIALPTI